MSALGEAAAPPGQEPADQALPAVVGGVEERLPEWQVDHVYCWDDTAQQVCPADPRVVEDLQRRGHFVLSLTSAFRTKLGSLQNLVNGPLLAKRDALLTQQAVVQGRIDEVKAATAAIERETKHACEEVVERLRSTERFKLSLLLRDKVDLAKDVESIQGLVEEVSRRGQATSMIEFLGKEKHLKDRCDLLCGKPHKRELTVRADDFERELLTQREMSKKYSALQELVAVKDTIISQLLEDRAALQRRLQEVAKPRAGGEAEDAEEAKVALEPPEGGEKEGEGRGGRDDAAAAGRPEAITSEAAARPRGESGAKAKAADAKDWLMTIEHNGKRIEVYHEGEAETEVETGSDAV